jgi:hypothetical protein
MTDAINSRFKFESKIIRYVISFQLMRECNSTDPPKHQELHQFHRIVAMSMNVPFERTNIRELECKEDDTEPILKIYIELLEAAEGEISADEAIANLIVAISYGHHGLFGWNISTYDFSEWDRKPILQPQQNIIDPDTVITLDDESGKEISIPFKSYAFHQKMVDTLVFMQTNFKKNNITTWLSGGSLVGALRHGSIIPHDDDLDIELFDFDMPKVVRALQIFPFVRFEVGISDI